MLIETNFDFRVLGTVFGNDIGIVIGNVSKR